MRICVGWGLFCGVCVQGIFSTTSHHCKKQRPHIVTYSITMQGLFFFYFSGSLRCVVCPRAGCEGVPWDIFCQRAKLFILIWGKTLILSYFSLCPIFSCICVRSSLKSFLKSYFIILLFYEHSIVGSYTKDVFFH